VLHALCFVAGCLYFSVGFMLLYSVDTKRDDVEPDVFLWVAFPFVMLVWPPVVVYLAMKRKTAERRQLRGLDFAHKFKGDEPMREAAGQEHDPPQQEETSTPSDEENLAKEADITNEEASRDWIANYKCRNHYFHSNLPSYIPEPDRWNLAFILNSWYKGEEVLKLLFCSGIQGLEFAACPDRSAAVFWWGGGKLLIKPWTRWQVLDSRRGLEFPENEAVTDLERELRQDPTLIRQAETAPLPP